MYPQKKFWGHGVTEWGFRGSLFWSKNHENAQNRAHLGPPKIPLSDPRTPKFFLRAHFDCNSIIFNTNMKHFIGTYPIRPPLPATGGGEGVAEILSVGDEEGELKPGDWVIPARPMVGTWRSHVVSNDQVIIGIEYDVHKYR